MSALFRITLLTLAGVLGSLAQNGLPASSVPSAALVAAPGSPYAAGIQPRKVACGDFNGDGLPDLVLLDTGLDGNNATLTILLATQGTATVVPGPGGPLPLGSAYSAVAVGDFNHDGKLDIASAGAYEIKIWLGDGKGGFSLAPTSPINTMALGLFGVYAIGVGDFNHDGIPDLVVLTGTADSEVAILLGDGAGGFTTAPGTVAIGKACQQLTVADFNSDRNLDVAISCLQSNQVVVLLGDGTGQLMPDPKGPFSTGFLPIPIANGDFNGDGTVDIAVANETSLTILLGDGTGGFVLQPEIDVAGAYQITSLAVGDLDGDGRLDLAIANADGSNVFILLGDGKGGFEVAPCGPLNSPGTAYAVALADFNNDGRLDLAVSNTDAGTVSIFLGAPTAFSTLALSSSAAPSVGVPFPVTASVTTSGFKLPTGTVTVQEAAALIGTETLIEGTAVIQATLGVAGFQTLSGVYSGDPNTIGSQSPGLTLDVAKGSQTISFPALPRHTFGDPPFAVTASASSGLPVTFTVISGPATIDGNLVTLTGAGTVILQASQPGNANYLPAPSVQQQLQVAAPLLQLDTVVNAASYSAGSIAPDSFAVLFGVDLASLATAPGSLTLTLGGSNIQVTDASGKMASALLYYASPAQMNFLLPSNLSPGNGTLTITNQAGLSAATQISIAAVSPGLFSADATGTGVAAGNALRMSADGTPTSLPISSCSGKPLVCTAIPIDLGSDSDTVYLSLYGTGIRGRTALSAVTATIGGIVANVQYAGPQPQYPGLDQVNLQIDPALRGRGNVQIALSVDGYAANVVSVAIQ